ncbi:uncharacterized protein LOC126671188 [Mercurialis annua]|uniref:uncharacterized protein LOC126671188 n=1 Tax=Mercurialis annua TaxID=3986 RepID=UPI00215E9FE6|nr:uncharacterized protein LOC126671188 [Mercurialis annua]
MRMALLSKNKMKFVDGSIVTPTTDDRLYPIWKRCNTRVLSWLVNSLTPTISQSVISFDSALEIWNDLKDMFSQGDYVRISDLQQEIYSLKQGSLSVTEFYTKLKVVWDEFVHLRPLPTCSCNDKCNCGGYMRMKTYYENDYTLCFVRGLNENFASLKSQMLKKDPLPKINKVFGLAIQQERQADVSDIANPIDSAVFFIAMQDQIISIKILMLEDQVLLTVKGGFGHTIEKCFKKHGYPPGHPALKPPGKQITGSANMAEGQLYADSFEQQHQQDYQTYDQAYDQNDNMMNMMNMQNDESMMQTQMQNQNQMMNMSFTQDQYMKIMAMIQPEASSSQASNHVSKVNALTSHFDTAMKPGIIACTSFVSNVIKDKSIWILDSGATDHIIVIPHIFKSTNYRCHEA